MRKLIALLGAYLPAAMVTPATAQPGLPAPHILVYKTNADYSDLVQVEMAANGNTISVYPAPTDVNDHLAPRKLKKGYWLSAAGISGRTAFLSISRKAYASRKEAPSEAEMMGSIRDRSPLVELWDCGERGSLSERSINKLIKKKRLGTKCKRIK